MIGITKKDQLKRMAPLKEKPFKSKAYLSCLHSNGLGCMICGDTNIELHHIDQGNRGRADNRVVPLCLDHHRGKFSPHGFDKKAFLEQYGETMEEVAKKLWEVYGD